MAIVEYNSSSDAAAGNSLAAPIATLLQSVRQRIRRYLWAEGLAGIAAYLLAAFWITLVFDWFFEPNIAIRAVLLAIVFGGASWIGFRLLLDRLRVDLTDRSLALLLERKFPQFGDSLLTAVEYASSSEHATDYERQMVAAAVDEAIERVREVDLDRLFNPAPLVRNVLLAVALGVSAVGFTLFDSEAVETWARRVLTFSNEPWPRKTRLVIEGFDGGSVKVARGSDVELIVKADTTMRVPQSVRVQYRTDEGLRGRAAMVQRGKAVPGRDAYQQFSHNFQGVLTPITFEVIGGDDRHRGLRIEVVDSPTVTALTLHCEYPAYMHREPRDIPVSGAMQVPRGTKTRVHFTTNKELTELDISDAGEKAQADSADPQTVKTTTIRPGTGQPSREFDYDLGALDTDRTLLISLLDTDNIRNREPNRLSITAVADEVPHIDVRLRGIGTAITPQAQLPLVGEMKDDYGIAKSWFEFTVDGQQPFTQDLTRAPRENTELPIDEAFDVRPRDLKPGQKVSLAVKAQDTFTLDANDSGNGEKSSSAGPQTGASSPFSLDVVTAEALRSMLEARELNLRRRFEQLLGEVTESRDALGRLRPREAAADGKAPAADEKPAEPEEGESGDAPATPEALAERALVRDRLRVEQVLQNSRKNADETLGVAVAFDDIHDELVNNRVDTEELKSRLKQGIAEPLKKLAGPGFSQLEVELTALQNGLADAAKRGPALDAAEKQLDSMLFEMQQVLGKMLEMETFNEVVDMLRSIIDSQKELNTKTKDSRKTKLRDLLE